MSTNSSPNEPLDSSVHGENPSSRTGKPSGAGPPAVPTNRPPARFAVVDRQQPPNDDLWLRFKQNLHTFCGTVLSVLMHCTLLVFLALLVYSRGERVVPGLAAEIVSPPQQQTLVEVEQPEITIEVNPVENESPIENLANDRSADNEIPTPDLDFSQAEPSPPNDPIAPVVDPAPVAAEATMPVGGGLQGRSADARGALAAKYGGTPASELAVENGLKWLARHQYPDGSWRLDFTGGPCDGRCANPGTREVTTAATGLTLMAFLGAGYTHQQGPYQQQVQNGLDYLKSRMRKTVFGGNLTDGSMYGQGIAVIALSEAYIMTKDESLRETIELAMQYIVTAQHQQGGWRYVPAQPGDTTVTGWQIMALKSCSMAGFDVPEQTIRKARKFLYSVGNDSDGFFGYQTKSKDPTSTAIGLLIQMFLGWDTQHRGMLAGTRYLQKLGPSENNIYFNYYATLTLFHSRHSSWESWNQQMRDYLIQTQSKTGHESGSWFFREKYGTVGGRLYTTAMAVMILEVYYRYLPLFDRDMVRATRK